MSPAAQLAAALASKPKRSKFGNRPVVTDEGRFDSQKEHRRWCALKLMERAGEISELRRQVRYPLEVNGHLVAAYIADHVYHERGTLVVEDVKSSATRSEPSYRLKNKLMAAIHGITIREV